MNHLPVTVVIAVYNGENFIRQAIESVLAQSLEDVEIIVVDDGSTDQTRDVLKLFGERLQILTQPNVGVSAARNRAIRAAKNEFIAFLDADDYFLLTTKLAEQAEILHHDKTFGIVHSGWQEVDGQGGKIKEHLHWQNKSTLTLADWLHHAAPLPSAMMFRRTALLKVGGFDEQMGQAEDVDLVFRLTLAGYQTRWLEKITVAYRQHPLNATKNIRAQTEGIERCWSKFFAAPSLPFDIRIQEKHIRYATLLRAALHAYIQSDYSEMDRCLQKSLLFAGSAGTGILLEWLEFFRQGYAAATHRELDVFSLLETTQWRNLEEIV